MSEFKAGDMVKRTGPSMPSEDMYTDRFYRVSFATRGTIHVEGNGYTYDSRNFKLADEAPVADATSPGYYEFPGGHEVRHISAHLTSFGGQALQYIARSTRLDGKNKGDTVENLKKAIKFLEWEIERIEDGA